MELFNVGEHLFLTLADGLVEEGYVVIDQFLDSVEMTLLLEASRFFFDQGDFRKAGIGKGDMFRQDTTVRGDYIRWIDRENTPVSCHFFFDRMEGLIRYLNRTCYLGIRESELHFAIYPVGTYYQRHLDVFKNSGSRKLSIVCYLNDHWKEEEGGQLRLFLPQPDGSERALDIYPIGGRLVCLLSDRIEHAVLPASRERFSLTGWLKN